MNSQPSPSSHKADRRQFFAFAVRCLAAGGLTAFTVAQVIKEKRLAGDPRCIRLHTCAHCAEFAGGCAKSKAVAYRTNHG